MVDSGGRHKDTILAHFEVISVPGKVGKLARCIICQMEFPGLVERMRNHINSHPIDLTSDDSLQSVSSGCVRSQTILSGRDSFMNISSDKSDDEDYSLSESNFNATSPISISSQSESSIIYKRLKPSIQSKIFGSWL